MHSYQLTMYKENLLTV